jgi:hypothetical protein
MALRGIILAQRFTRTRRVSNYVCTLSDLGSGVISGNTIASGWNNFAGREISNLLAIPGLCNLELQINGSGWGSFPAEMPQNFFTSLIVDDPDDTPVTFLSADAATFSNSSNTGLWRWGDGSSPFWAAGDDSENKTVLVL